MLITVRKDRPFFHYEFSNEKPAIFTYAHSFRSSIRRLIWAGVSLYVSQYLHISVRRCYITHPMSIEYKEGASPTVHDFITSTKAFVLLSQRTFSRGAFDLLTYIRTIHVHGCWLVICLHHTVIC